MSISKPEMQHIRPPRTKLGQEILKGLKPVVRIGDEIICDYSELEPRVLAELMKQPFYGISLVEQLMKGQLKERKTMGNSASSSIIFGYVFNTENVWPWQVDEDFLEEGEEADIKRDWGEREWYLHIARNKTVSEVEAMEYEEKNAVWSEIPIEVDCWGYMEDACYMIYPTGAAITTSWDQPSPIDLSWFHDDEKITKWLGQLSQFVKEMKIDLEGRAASFQMVASYG